MDAYDAGHVAFAFYGTTDSTASNWDAYISESRDATSAHPTFWAAAVNRPDVNMGPGAHADEDSSGNEPVDDGSLRSDYMPHPVGWAMSRPPGDGAIDGAMLVDDFVPLVRERLHVDRVALMGWSMGGYGALLAFERHPDLFAAAALGSAALWLDAGDTSPGAFDGADDFAANDVWRGLDDVDAVRVRVDCGTHDPFLSADRELARRLGPAVTASFTERLSRRSVLAVGRARSGALPRVGAAPQRCPCLNGGGGI